MKCLLLLKRMLYDVEEDYDLGVTPKLARFSPAKGGASRHLMVNGSSERIGIKIKCSNNNVYRISPVYTILEPGKAQRLQQILIILRPFKIVRDPGEPGLDKLVVLYLNTNLKNVREAFVLAKREAEERAKEKDKKKREMKPINPIRKALIRLDARPSSEDGEPTPPQQPPPLLEPDEEVNGNLKNADETTSSAQPILNADDDLPTTMRRVSAAEAERTSSSDPLVDNNTKWSSASARNSYRQYQQQKPQPRDNLHQLPFIDSLRICDSGSIGKLSQPIGDYGSKSKE